MAITTGLLVLPALSADRLVALAKTAERLGYDYFWIADERFFREVYVGLALCAAHTERIQLGPCVTDPYSRQIMMSHGTFLELLDIAARERGLTAEITLFPEGAFGSEQLDQRPGGTNPAGARCGGEEGPAVRADPCSSYQPQPLRPRAAGAGCSVAGNERSSEAESIAVRLLGHGTA